MLDRLHILSDLTETPQDTLRGAGRLKISLPFFSRLMKHYMNTLRESLAANLKKKQKKQKTKHISGNKMLNYSLEQPGICPSVCV